MPADLLTAIEQANRICSWQENLTRDEIPPSWMWHLEEELQIWFQGVDDKRKSGSSTGGSEDEAPDLAQNVLAKGRRG